MDHRTDIFSLGIILYEMATGRRPFQGSSSAELASAILRDAPPSATKVRRGLPASLQRVIESCLQKDPIARPQTARDLQSLLATISSTGANSSDDAGGEDQSIAVLPFASLSPDPDDEFFADGVTEEILNALAQIPGLRVAGRSSAFSFKGKNEDLRSVGAKLKVSTILEGTLRRAGSRLRITAQLIDADSGYQLWSERYDRVMEDVFAVQDEIASDDRRTPPADARRRQWRSSAPPPHAASRGVRAVPQGTRAAVSAWAQHSQGLECFSRPWHSIPPTHRPGPEWPTVTRRPGYSGFKPGATVMPRALEAARRALELDPVSPRRITRSRARPCCRSGTTPSRSRSPAGAIELNPNYSRRSAGTDCSFCSGSRGAPGGTRGPLTAASLDPLSALRPCHSCILRRDAGRRGCHGTVDEASSSIRTPTSAQWSLTGVARSTPASTTRRPPPPRRRSQCPGRHNWALYGLAYIYGASGTSPTRPRDVPRIGGRGASREYVQPSMLAPAAAAVGDMDLAISLRRAGPPSRRTHSSS